MFCESTRFPLKEINNNAGKAMCNDDFFINSLLVNNTKTGKGVLIPKDVIAHYAV